MKADPYGTHVEQFRYYMGWKPRAQIVAEGGDLERCCGACRSRWFKEIDRRDGGKGVSPYCGHVEAGGVTGHATRESATCKYWAPKL